MAHLIDKAALVAEIERRRSKNAKNKLNLAASFEDNYLLSFIDTLEVKEVDLEKEIDKAWDDDYADFGISVDDFYRVTRYFFELGLKAQKGEKV